MFARRREGEWGIKADFFTRELHSDYMRITFPDLMYVANENVFAKSVFFVLSTYNYQQLDEEMFSKFINDTKKVLPIMVKLDLLEEFRKFDLLFSSDMPPKATVKAIDSKRLYFAFPLMMNALVKEDESYSIEMVIDEIEESDNDGVSMAEATAEDQETVTNPVEGFLSTEIRNEINTIINGIGNQTEISNSHLSQSEFSSFFEFLTPQMTNQIFQAFITGDHDQLIATANELIAAYNNTNEVQTELIEEQQASNLNENQVLALERY